MDKEKKVCLEKCPKCGADVVNKSMIISLQYRGDKQDITKQIFKLEGVFSWEELEDEEK